MELPILKTQKNLRPRDSLKITYLIKKNAFGDMSESVLLFLMAVTCEQFGVFYLITPTILTFSISMDSIMFKY